MALQLFTTNPKALLGALNKRIDQKDPKGKITTWVRDSDGDYTHVAKEWAAKACRLSLKPNSFSSPSLVLHVRLS